MVYTKIKLTWEEIQGWHLVTNVDISSEHEFSYSDHWVWSQGHWEEWLSPPDPRPFLPPLYNICLLRSGTGSVLFTVVCTVPEAMLAHSTLTEWRRSKEHIPPPHGCTVPYCLFPLSLVAKEMPPREATPRFYSSFTGFSGSFLRVGLDGIE